MTATASDTAWHLHASFTHLAGLRRHVAVLSTEAAQDLHATFPQHGETGAQESGVAFPAKARKGATP
jgi:hypothetical protein